MAQKVNIIGAGVAGLCTATMLQKMGFETEIFELHSKPGGLMTTWRRGDFRFENCIHWFVGSSENSTFYPVWKKVLDIENIEFHNHEIINSFRDKEGKMIRFYTNIDKLERELLEKAPEDKSEIENFIKGVRILSDFKMPMDFGENFTFPVAFRFFKNNFKLFPEYNKWRKISQLDFASRLKNPLLKMGFENVFPPETAMIFIVFTFVWLSKGQAGYPIGGSYKLARMLEANVISSGGKISYKAEVKKILVENNQVKGLELMDGSIHPSDYVVAASNMMDVFGKFLPPNSMDKKYRKRIPEFKPFPTYFQVSVGLKKPLNNQYDNIHLELKNKIFLDENNELESFGIRFFPYEPNYSPEGKDVMTVFLPCFDFDYWMNLKSTNPDFYYAEKERILNRTLEEIANIFPDLPEKIEVTDISSPATVYRYTRNHKGSMEGWIMSPKEGFMTLPVKSRKIKNLFFAGQWISPGGGLPSGLLTAFEVSKHFRKIKK